VLLIICLFAVPISLADLKIFKIPNIYLWLLCICLTPFIATNGFGPVTQLAFTASIILILSLCGMGMGDAKLLFLIALAFNFDHQFSFLIFSSYLLALATIHALVLALRYQFLPRRLPMAPSIFIALLLYLATR
jgi:Flp pilus assembly protein protease CpaA